MPQPAEKREQAPALHKGRLSFEPIPGENRTPTVKLKNWPHAPSHFLRDAGTYIVTVATYKKTPIFRSPARLTPLTNSIPELAEHYSWQLQAWAVFPNHYHLIGNSKNPHSLRSFLRHLHSVTAIEANRLDNSPGRRVWFQFWETRITFPRSFLARLNYVHQNPVHHKIVRMASLYPWCSAGWFEQKAPRPFFQTVSNFKTDKLIVPDDFEVPSINGI